MTAGLLLAIAAPWAPVAAAGFALVGVGAANVVPVAFSGASRVPGMPWSTGVAAVTTMGYVGFLATPPVLGFVAHTFGLSASMAVVALMSAAVALIAAATSPPLIGAPDSASRPPAEAPRGQPFLVSTRPACLFRRLTESTSTGTASSSAAAERRRSSRMS